MVCDLPCSHSHTLQVLPLNLMAPDHSPCSGYYALIHLCPCLASGPMAIVSFPVWLLGLWPYVSFSLSHWAPGPGSCPLKQPCNLHPASSRLKPHMPLALLGPPPPLISSNSVHQFNYNKNKPSGRNAHFHRLLC